MDEPEIASEPSPEEKALKNAYEIFDSNIAEYLEKSTQGKPSSEILDVSTNCLKELQDAVFDLTIIYYTSK